MLNFYYGRPFFTVNAVIFLAITLILIIFFDQTIPQLTAMPQSAYVFLVSWLCVAIIFTIISLRYFIIGYLISLFCMMVTWRIASLYNLLLPSYLLTVTFFLFFLNFIACAKKNLKQAPSSINRLSIGEWQLVFIRIYIGLNFIPHFTEKLFAGTKPHMEDVKAFTQLGVPYPDFFVWTAGLCEFGAAIALAIGFFPRVGAYGAALYLIIATHLGRHFAQGFIWANKGGGWEFSTLWTVLILSYAITGFRRFTVDECFRHRHGPCHESLAKCRT